MNEFPEAVRRCGRVSPGESLELGGLARRQVSAFGLLPHEVAEEFFKPALDCGVSVSHALRIEERVKKAIVHSAYTVFRDHKRFVCTGVGKRYRIPN